uniref:Acetyl-coenzyme A carboxylase carboxyl transferase subunit beta, chloroplastic n=1 Tax=Musa beccarii TaxID=192045 RepID=A0A411L1N6_MUSBE|nr:acetyl-CoA carboxylase carboxyltransferase beta subunit [Musa beccarii]QBE86238.1 acetyl-CoA carboxylase beta subunit [Musa beccarii]UCC37642.1 acetyl-CoA carboxylase carboxyltransferase beta subunit [Musa beccarii]BCT08748.1 acetyl-CoA carboxylase beta subunit [Musa beccarii]
MGKWWFHSMLSNEKLEHRCGLSKSMDSLDGIGHTSGSEQPILNDTKKKIPSWNHSGNYSFTNVDSLFEIKDIWSLISDDTFLVRDSNGDSYSVYFDIENLIFEVDNDSSFLSELEKKLSSYLSRGSKKKNHYYYYYMHDTQSSWNNHINSCIDSYLHFEVSINSSISGSTNNYSDSYFYNFICTENRNSSESGRSSKRTRKNFNDFNEEVESDFNEEVESDFNEEVESDFNEEVESDFNEEVESDFNEEVESDFNEEVESDFNEEVESDFNEEVESDFNEEVESDFNEEVESDFNEEVESDFHEEVESDFHEEVESDFHEEVESNDFDINQKYRHLWVQCENCYGLNYKKFFKSKMNICEQCGCHLKMSSSDRIELSIDPGTWDPLDKDMISIDPIDFHSKEEPYRDRIGFYQRNTGLSDAVQTGIGQLNGIPVAIGVMDFQFMGGSMGSVVGEKITRLIEYATNRSLPVIIVCASGGARMQEGSLSLMQMAKISSASFNYQSDKKLFYVSILTSPTTGGVTASFGMLGDIIIAEPNAYIAFAGKRVIEQTLKKVIPEGSQVSEYLFDKGLFDPIVPRNLLKGVLGELFQLHGFFPLNPSSKM